MTLCKFKNMFGEPNTGLHSIRIFNIAIIDVLLTIIAGLYISKQYNYKLINVLIVLFISGIIIHKLFCVKTKLNEMLGL